MTRTFNLASAAILSVLAQLTLTPTAAAQSDAVPGDPGIVVRHSDLKPEPSEKAETKASLSLGTRVQVSEFWGRWARVAAAESGQGWIPAANVRISQKEAKTGGAMTGFLRRITGAVSSRPSSSGESAHMGIRGLEPGDVANARPNPAELAKLNAYRATRPTAEKHARDVQLARRAFDYVRSTETAQRSSNHQSTPSDRN